MATVGLRDLFVAPVTIGADGAESYETPRRLAKAIQVDMSTEVAEGTLYADDGVDETVKEFVSGEITANVNDIAPSDLAFLLGQQINDAGVIYAGDADDPPYVAIAFRAKKTGGKYRYVWLYKVKFAVPDETYNTKADGITFNTPTIVGVYIKRDRDGLWKADYTGLPTDAPAAAWFTEVMEYTPPTIPTP